MSLSRPFEPLDYSLYNAVCVLQYEPSSAQQPLPAAGGNARALQRLRGHINRLKLQHSKNENIKFSQVDKHVELWWYAYKGGDRLHVDLARHPAGTAITREGLVECGITDIRIYFLPNERRTLSNDWKAFWSWKQSLKSLPRLHDPASTSPDILSPTPPSSSSGSDSALALTLPAEESIREDSSINLASVSLRKSASVTSKATHRFSPYSRPDSAVRSSSRQASPTRPCESSLGPPPSPTQPPTLGIPYESLIQCLRMLRNSVETDVKDIIQLVQENTRALFELEPDLRPNFDSDSPRTIHDAILKAVYTQGQRVSANRSSELDAAEERARDLQRALDEERREHASLKSAHAEVQATVKAQTLEIQRLLGVLNTTRQEADDNKAELNDTRSQLAASRSATAIQRAALEQTRYELNTMHLTAARLQQTTAAELHNARMMVEMSRQTTVQSQLALERVRAEQSTPFLTPALLNAFIGISDIVRSTTAS